MIVTIDGPAGAGKSSVARALAERLGFHFLDTGAMYRCVAWAALQANLDWTDTSALTTLAMTLDIQVGNDDVKLDGQDVTKSIRTMEVTSVIHFVADNADVRRQLVRRQRAAATGGDFVTEGRDQGTVVFPDANCKIFLTASPEERAKRRMAELVARGEELDFSDVLARQNERDLQDRARKIGGLIAADDAIHYDTTGRALDEVVDALEQIARDRIPLTRNA